MSAVILRLVEDLSKVLLTGVTVIAFRSSIFQDEYVWHTEDDKVLVDVNCNFFAVLRNNFQTIAERISPLKSFTVAETTRVDVITITFKTKPAAVELDKVATLHDWLQPKQK